MLLAVAIGLAAPAMADQSFPVCLQSDGMDCSYTSIEQCKATASGRAAYCLANPLYAPEAARPSGPVERRHRARR
jgi:Protein of unknown function (DUF3551)